MWDTALCAFLRHLLDNEIDASTISRLHCALPTLSGNCCGRLRSLHSVVLYSNCARCVFSGGTERTRHAATVSVPCGPQQVINPYVDHFRNPLPTVSLLLAYIDGSLSMHALLPASKVFAAAVGFTVFVVWVNFGPGSGHVRKQTRSPPSSPMASSSLVPVSVTEPSQSNETSQDAASNNSSAAVSSNPAKKSKNSAPATQSSTGCLQTTQSPRSLQQSCASAEPSLVIASSKVDLVAGPSDSNSKQQISNAQHEITDPSNSGNIEDDESGT